MRDGVTIGPLPSFPPNVNDIIFCQRENGSPVMHRVYRIDGGTVWINGDAQTWLEPVTEDRVIGVVTHIRRGAKQYLVNAPWIRFYTIAWGLLRPIRGFGFNLYRRAKGLGAR
jgi:hypothetical protein